MLLSNYQLKNEKKKNTRHTMKFIDFIAMRCTKMHLHNDNQMHVKKNENIFVIMFKKDAESCWSC